MDHLRTLSQLGTRFLRPPDHLLRQIQCIRAYLFDWDGVFNDGWKDADGGSPFSEVGSMGVNLLRYGSWLHHKKLPVAAILTGQQNPSAVRFAEREHFHAIYMGFTHKVEAFDHFLAEHALDAKQVAFFFDDVLDLPVARRCGLRIQIRQPAAPLTENFISSKMDADLLTKHSGGQNGVREACETVLALLGKWEQVLENRIGYSDSYRAYLSDRQAVNTEVVAKER
ncbi:MAG: hypothetical protein KDB88_07320 [Flavobacteriales bacterium]|nr:hypothetical protein [Flavobacteriales bacterium]